MLLRAELPLRTTAMSCRLQPSVMTPCTYHTAASNQPTPSPRTTRRRVALPSPAPSNPTSQIVRYASTAAPASQSSPTAESPSALSHQLNWDTFFKLRRTRRRLQLGSSVGTSAVSMVAGAQVLAVSDMDAIVGQVPLDPFITLGLITFSCGGLGWLVGPIVGTAVFNTMNRKYIPDMTMKEKEFYNRIKKFRVDPSASSMANPVPDYYGEKISSVSGYRQWLKDQRAFNKKRTTYVA